MPRAYTRSAVVATRGCAPRHGILDSIEESKNRADSCFTQNKHTYTQFKTERTNVPGKIVFDKDKQIFGTSVGFDLRLKRGKFHVSLNRFVRFDRPRRLVESANGPTFKSNTVIKIPAETVQNFRFDDTVES